DTEADATDAGVLIVEVAPDSPAAGAGLTRGDIVLRVNDEVVNDAAALRQAIGDLHPEETVTLTVLHGDDERTLTVTLGERNDRALLGVVPYVSMAMIERPEVHTFQRRFLPAVPPIDEMMGGETVTVTLVIVEVAEESPAAAAGLQPEDVITAINGETLTRPRALITAVNELAPGNTLTLTVQPAGEEAEATDVVVTLGENPDDVEHAYLGVRFAPQVRITRDVQDEGTLPHFRFRAPRFAHPGGQWQEEQREGAWNERSFGFPFLRRFFFWRDEAPAGEVRIFRGAPGEFDLEIDPQWELDADGFLVTPDFAMPTVPTMPAVPVTPVELEILDEVI
ncbi:MAG: PDZ domain-containing protein, partial [Caldilineaceae bacterium]|nr:PDZ domain-containing protein [Caldilineaceae bacterium]